MNIPVQIPDGFKQDAKGRLIPESQIKPIDIERSDLVTALIEKAKEQQQQLCDFKALAFGDIAAFVQLSAEQYEVNLGGAKGNLTLFSFDRSEEHTSELQSHHDL